MQFYDTNELTYQIERKRNLQTYRLNLWLLVRGRMRGRKVREFGMDMYAMPYLKWITIKDLLYSTGNSAQRDVPAWMGGQFGGECMCYVWLSPFAVHLKLSQHCLLSNYTPTQNKKFFKKRMHF